LIWCHTCLEGLQLIASNFSIKIEKNKLNVLVFLSEVSPLEFNSMGKLMPFSLMKMKQEDKAS